WRQPLDFLLAIWERSGRDSDTHLRGVFYRESLDWLSKRRRDLNTAEQTYIRRSTPQSTLIVQSLRRALPVVAGALVTAAGVFGYQKTAFHQVRRAIKIAPAADTRSADG